MPLAPYTDALAFHSVRGPVLLMEARAAARIDALYERHGNELRRFLVSRLRNRNDIDDCIQETFFDVWRQEIRGTLRDNTRGYLFTTAMNVARDICRRGRARREAQQEPLSDHMDSISSTDDADRLLSSRECLRLVQNELANVRPSTREVFLLHHVMNMSFDEISRHLGISTRTVEREMARALAHLQTALGDMIKDILG
jgi:RNA polymerase sigma factor (sigma-70 family)